MANEIKRIAINTGGGDAPGLNAVIRAIVLSALHNGWECYGIRDGYNGIMFPENYPKGDGVIRMTRQTVRGITHQGGTILGTTNKGSPLKFPVVDEDGQVHEVDRSDELIAAFREHGFDTVIAIGGDGSLTIANALSKKGMRMIGVPKTIDNDLEETVTTFGFDSAVAFATECIDRLHTTAEAHDRIMVVEVMGRYAGWIALHAGIAGSADAILIPEIPYDIAKVAEKIEQRHQEGRNFAVVVVAEGAKPLGGSHSVVGKELGQAERLGGVGAKVTADLIGLTGKAARTVVLGHLLRGGSPTAYDRLISLRFGAAAVRAVADGVAGVMVALDPPNVRYVPLELATRRMKLVPLDSDTVLTARSLGTCLGD